MHNFLKAKLEMDACANCGHLIEQTEGKTMHLTRAYKPYGFPYATPECHAPDCRCQEPKQNMKVFLELRKILVKAWCRDTCFFKDMYDGTGRGQCYGTAILIQKLFGGHVVMGNVDRVRHYWNKLPNGAEVDLTSDQFGGNGINPVGRRITQQSKARVNKRSRRYLLLKERFEKILESESDADKRRKI